MSRSSSNTITIHAITVVKLVQILLLKVIPTKFKYRSYRPIESLVKASIFIIVNQPGNPQAP